MKHYLVLILTSLILSAGCFKKKDSKALIIGGKESDVQRLPAVLFLAFSDGLCTGTLLEDTSGTPGEMTVILSAAHCVVSILGKGIHQKIYPANTEFLSYTQETDSSLGRKNAEILKIIIPTALAKRVNGDANQAKHIMELDVALIVVRNLTAGMKGARIDYENPVAPGDPAILAGYGCDVRQSPNTFQSGGGTLREATVKISSVQSTKIIIQKGTNPVQAQTCEGDSGGALYAGNNTLLIRGVHSSGSGLYSQLVPLHRESAAGRWLLTTYPLVAAF